MRGSRFCFPFFFRCSRSGRAGAAKAFARCCSVGLSRLFFYSSRFIGTVRVLANCGRGSDVRNSACGPVRGCRWQQRYFFLPRSLLYTSPSLSPRAPPSPLSRLVRGTREMWRLRSWLPRPLFILAGEAANERSAQPKQGGACNNSGQPSIFAEGPSAPRASGLDRFLPSPIYLSASLLLSVAWQQPPGSHLGLFPGLGLLRLVLTPSGRVGTPFCCGCSPSASACVLFRTRARSIDSRRWHHCHFPRGITSVSLYPSVAAGPSG